MAISRAPWRFNQGRTWPILTASGFANSNVPQLTLSSMSFQSIYPNGGFSLSLSPGATPNTLLVTWNPVPVPEPGAILAICGLAGVSGAIYRRKQSKSV